MLDGKEAQVDYKLKCLDCDESISVPHDTEIGEILSCPGCGLEYEVKSKTKEKVEAEPYQMEGEDWGE